MKETPFTEAMKELIEFDIAIMDEFISEEIELLEDIGNPEKLIGKKYEDWTPQDLQMLTQVYGDDSALTNLIFKREYETVRELEAKLKEE